MMKLITLHQKEEWKAFIKKSLHYDFYHTWHYHSLDKSGEALLFVYEEEGSFIAFPLIKRLIPDSSMFDLTSVYGYAGPVSNRSFKELDNGFLNNFRSAFLNYLRKEGCISVFSRLHPFMEQELVMKKFGGVYEHGKTVAIDLSVSIEEQRQQYNKSVRYFLKKACRKGFYVKEGRSLYEIYLFTYIYQQNMRRVNANDSYWFHIDYFVELLKSKDFDSKLILVYEGNKAISGAIITYTNGIAQVHLVATLTEYLNDSPAKFLIDQITLAAREAGMKFCHLGGGVGFKEDSLFQWKAGFSNLHLCYQSWRFIADKPVYKSLVSHLGITEGNESDFFPLYRSKQFLPGIG